METEQRGAPRAKLLVYFDVLGRDNGARVGYLANLSETGLMLITGSHFEPGTRINLRVELPDAREGTGPVDAEVQVVWTHPSADPELQCVGCRILLIAPETLHQLLEAARAYSFNPDFDVNRMVRAG